MAVLNIDTIKENIELLSMNVSSLKGNIKYKLVNPEEDAYEIEGDAIGLMKYGIEFLKAAVHSSLNQQVDKFEKLPIEVGELFSRNSEVFPISINCYKDFQSVDQFKVPKETLKTKLIGFLILFLILGFVAMALIGLVTTVKWFL